MVWEDNHPMRIGISGGGKTTTLDKDLKEFQDSKNLKGKQAESRKETKRLSQQRKKKFATTSRAVDVCDDQCACVHVRVTNN